MNIRCRITTLAFLLLPAFMLNAQNSKIAVSSDQCLSQNLEKESKNMTDFEAIQNLVVAERMYRVSHRNKELAECYAPDASIHTSWQSGGVNTFVGKESVEAQKSLPIVNRCNPPLIHI